MSLVYNIVCKIDVCLNKILGHVSDCRIQIIESENLVFNLVQVSILKPLAVSISFEAMAVSNSFEAAGC